MKKSIFLIILLSVFCAVYFTHPRKIELESDHVGELVEITELNDSEVVACFCDTVNDVYFHQKYNKKDIE